LATDLSDPLCMKLAAFWICCADVVGSEVRLFLGVFERVNWTPRRTIAFGVIEVIGRS